MGDELLKPTEERRARLRWARAVVCLSMLVTAACGDDGSQVRRGTETCLVCRLSRELTLDVAPGFPIREEHLYANDCSKWVAANEPDHEHTWVQVGCWVTEPEFPSFWGITWRSIGCSATHPVMRVPSWRWLELLQHASPYERAQMERVAAGPWFELDDADKALIDSWE